MDCKTEVKEEVAAVEDGTSINGKELSPSDPEISYENDATTSQEPLEIDSKMNIKELDVSKTHLKNEVCRAVHHRVDITGGNNFEMEQKPIIKEELDVFNKYSLNERKLGSTDHKSYYGSNSSTRSCEFELDNNIIKEEMDISDTNLPSESACFSTDFEKVLNNDGVAIDFELDNNTKLKGWASLSDVGNEQKYFSRDLIKEIKKGSVTVSEKDEANVGGMSKKTAYQLKVPAMKVLQWNENMDEKMEELELAASSRLHVQTVCAEIQRTVIEPVQRTKHIDSERIKKFETDKEYSDVQVPNNYTRLQYKGTGKLFSGKSVMKLQDINPEKLNPHRCSISQKSFSLRQASKNQKLIHKDKQTHKCNVCNKRFTRLYSLKTHGLIHKGEKPHECHVCNKRFADMSNLRNHSMMHKGEKPHECNVCNKRFTQLSNLKTHSLIHKREKAYKCNVCNKSFTLLCNLKSHSLIHTGEKPHECNICNKGFSRISSLKNHSLIHKGEKPYVCNVCNKRFTWLSNLSEHILIHKGVKPHECNVCKKRYTRLSGLNHHSWIHKGEKPYECNVCNKRFTRQASLNHHILIHKGE